MTMTQQPEPSDTPTIDAATFRSVLGHFPTSVTVVTAIDAAGNPVGLTIGSFVSVSLDPPLVGFLPQTDSDTWRAIEASGHFVVNDLSCTQGDLCWSFAKRGNEDERFTGVPWTPAPSGAPIIGGAMAWIDCSIEAVHEMGDHYFVLGRVDALETVEPATEAEGDPLIFFKGKLGRFVPVG